MLKRAFVAFVLFASVVGAGTARAQATATLSPVYNGVMNRSIADVIIANLERRGLVTAASAASDAVLSATLSAVGAAADVAAYANAAALGVVSVASSPVWGTALIGTGALAAVGSIGWDVYQLTQSGTSSVPTLTMTPEPAGTTSSGTSSSNPASAPVASSSPTTEVPAEGAVYSLPSFTVSGLQPLPGTVPYYVSGMLVWQAAAGCTAMRDCVVAMANYDAKQFCLNNPSYVDCVVSVNASPDSYATDQYGVSMPTYSGTLTYYYASTLQPGSATIWSYVVEENSAYVKPQAVTGPLSSMPITPPMLTEPLPGQLTAELADSLFQEAAASSGYTGYPYAATAPVSAADVSTAGVTPTWADMFEGTPKGASDSSVTIAPDFYPTSSTGSASTGTNTGSSACASGSDLAGCVPLGTVPGSSAIPASSASISFTPWAIGAVDGTCPVAQTVTILGADYAFAFDPLCSVVQQLRPLILTLCALAAAFIVAMGVSL